MATKSDLSRQLTMAASLLREGNEEEFDRLKNYFARRDDQVGYTSTAKHTKTTTIKTIRCNMKIIINLGGLPGSRYK